jgi:hypothetical protein
MMHMGRHRFAEKIIRVIVAIIVSPTSVHIVCPTSVVMIPYTPFPTRNIASACYAGRSTLHQASAARDEMPVMSRFRGM